MLGLTESCSSPACMWLKVPALNSHWTKVSAGCLLTHMRHSHHYNQLLQPPPPHHLINRNQSNTGASPISAEVMMFLRVCFGCHVLEGYGMTGVCVCLRTMCVLPLCVRRRGAHMLVLQSMLPSPRRVHHRQLALHRFIASVADPTLRPRLLTHLSHTFPSHTPLFNTTKQRPAAPSPSRALTTPPLATWVRPCPVWRSSWWTFLK